jgi:hypothetical protein
MTRKIGAMPQTHVMFFLLDQKELKNQEKTMLLRARPALPAVFSG